MVKGDRVRGVGAWFTWFGRSGTVTGVEPLRVLFDGERLPVHVRENEVVLDTLRPPPFDWIGDGAHVWGAE